MTYDLSKITVDLSTVGGDYQVFLRNWYAYCEGGIVPALGRKTVMGYAKDYATARAWCEQYNATNDPGPLSRKAEFTSSY